MVIVKNKEERGFLSSQEIMLEIKQLSYSQGAYGRLLEEIEENEEMQEALREVVKEQKFKDFVDFILWYEG